MNDTTQTSGDQVTPQQSAVVPPSATETSQSYYDSEELLSKRIGELTQTAQTGSYDEIAKASEELSEIERVLERSKNQLSATPAVAVTETPTAAPAAEVPNPTSNKADRAAVKKFGVFYGGKRHEVDDANGLLGHKGTGDLKAALIKTQLMLKDRETRESDLERRLREAEEKLQARLAAQTPIPVAAVPPATTQSAAAIPKPVPPALPKLSTNDPSLYSESDITELTTYNSRVSEFNTKLVEYTEALGNRVQQLDPATQARIDALEARSKKADEIVTKVERDKEIEAQEKIDQTHWQRFVDFQNRPGRESFRMPLPPKQMNDEMNKWTAKIAVANGATPETSGPIVEKYINGDATVLQNSEGFPPPDGYEAYFKNLEVFLAYKNFVKEGVITEKASLEDAYALHKIRSGEMADDLEALRTAERASAVETFANGVQQMQQHAAGIDPSKSSGGPDLNAIGISDQDLRWYMSVTPQGVQKMETSDPDSFKKWNAIADKVLKYFR
jgi:hypothetical protein